jgi:hypothetical protein
MALPRSEAGTGDREGEPRTAEDVVPVEAESRRPAPVTVLAVLRLATGAIYAALTVWILIDRESALSAISASSRFGNAIAPLPTPMVVAFGAGIAIASLAAGILLLRLQLLGWTLAMLLSGLTLLIGILIWWYEGSTNTAWMLIEVVSVFYLNQRRVKETFGIVKPRVPDQIGIQEL